MVVSWYILLNIMLAVLFQQLNNLWLLDFNIVF